jgi:competence protein ComEA
MWETIRGYLTFTRKERFGVLFLLLLICILFILPYLFQPLPGDPDPAAYEKLKKTVEKPESEKPDSLSGTSVNDHFKNGKTAEKPGVNNFLPAHMEMHNFDPNTTAPEDWINLGLSKRISIIISRYIEKGGRFRKPTDLKKIYGLDPSDYERLLPFVRIAGGTDLFTSRSEFRTKMKYGLFAIKEPDSVLNVRSYRKYAEPTSGKRLEVTDINMADSSDWSRLPGIGGRLASRIVRFREKLGGFYQVNQVSETFGLPDSTFQKIKSVLRMDSRSVLQLDINNASKELLQAHPYIGWQIAKEMVTFRTQHGKFRSVDELLQLAQMDTGRFEKLKPYLVVNP